MIKFCKCQLQYIIVGIVITENTSGERFIVLDYTIDIQLRNYSSALQMCDEILNFSLLVK